MKSRCRMDVNSFPFDEQTCIIEFISMVYMTNDLIYETDVGERKNILSFENQLWSYIKENAQVQEKPYSDYDYPFSAIEIKIKVQRKPLFFLVNLIVPAFFLSVVTLITFFVPFAQAMPISMNILVSYSVLSIR